ncbi:hypothetical protein AB0I77_47270 [Streptomyces sp. NPDC050619]|uniref:hypothetical protein n=1 Tax=Streptomyces sp. NPDC050619 TaxID=3157214 RepID=UPI00343C28DB
MSRCFAWRVAEELGHPQLADRLNADLLTNPPPTPVDAGVGGGTLDRLERVGGADESEVPVT